MLHSTFVKLIVLLSWTGHKLVVKATIDIPPLHKEQELNTLFIKVQIHYSPTFEVPSFDNQTNSQRGIKPAAMFVISPSLSVMGGLSDMARVEKTKLSISAMLSQDFLELNHIPLNICERFHGVDFFLLIFL